MVATTILSKEQVAQIAEALNFSTEEMEIIIPYMLKHRPKLESAEDFIRNWNDCWYRNFDFDKDIVDYEFQYIADYNYGGATGTDINDKEQLKEYLLKTYVHTLQDHNHLNGWSIYPIHEKLWIEFIS